jgi:hypothetical protein
VVAVRALQASAVDSSSVSNAAPAFARDGSGRLLLAYKGLGRAQPSKPPCTDGSGQACISVAAAPHWSGPYTRTSAKMGLIFPGEDPTLWQAPTGAWHMVVEHYTRDRSRSGAHAWSDTAGESWTVSVNSTWVPLKDSLDGRPVTLTKRERYQVSSFCSNCALLAPMLVSYAAVLVTCDSKKLPALDRLILLAVNR